MKKSICFNLFVGVVIACSLAPKILWSQSNQGFESDAVTEAAVRKSIDDGPLNKLVENKVSEDFLRSIYGRPDLVDVVNGKRKLAYNLSIRYAFLRDKSGRVGFTATFDEGKMVKWSPMFMTVAK